MLIHIVAFRYKAEVDERQRDEHRHSLRRLATLPDVVDLSVGGDVVKSARSFDTGLVIRFKDRDALERYQKDARHVPVAQLGASICQQIVSVDFQD